MYREYEYRAIAQTGNIWLYGMPIRQSNGECQKWTLIKDNTAKEINPATLGEFTGLIDIHEHKVFEWAIVRLTSLSDEPLIIVYYEQMFCLANQKQLNYLLKGSHPFMNDYAHLPALAEWSNTGLVTVVGNIFEQSRLNIGDSFYMKDSSETKATVLDICNNTYVCDKCCIPFTENLNIIKEG